MARRGGIDLSGTWDGIYAYPRSLPPTPFLANLREQGGAIVGETIEGERTLHALVQGTRTGTDVRFVKIYDSHHDSPIHYAGTVNGDATEISGRWHIPGVWSGSFLMVRRGGQEAEGEARTAETVAR